MYAYRCLDHDFVCSSANSEYKLIKGCLIGLADILLFSQKTIHYCIFQLYQINLANTTLSPGSSY